MAFDFLVFISAVIVGVFQNTVLGIITFWLLLNFVFKEYEMDFKSQIMLSLQTFGALSVAYALIDGFTGNFFLSLIFSLITALIVGDQLLIKTGLNKEEALKTAGYWIGLWTLVAIAAAGLIKLTTMVG